jgi:hypothetical protein
VWPGSSSPSRRPKSRTWTPGHQISCTDQGFCLFVWPLAGPPHYSDTEPQLLACLNGRLGAIAFMCPCAVERSKQMWPSWTASFPKSSDKLSVLQTTTGDVSLAISVREAVLKLWVSWVLFFFPLLIGSISLGGGPIKGQDFTQLLKSRDLIGSTPSCFYVHWQSFPWQSKALSMKVDRSTVCHDWLTRIGTMCIMDWRYRSLSILPPKCIERPQLYKVNRAVSLAL